MKTTVVTLNQSTILVEKDGTLQTTMVPLNVTVVKGSKSTGPGGLCGKRADKFSVATDRVGLSEGECRWISKS